MIKKGAITFFIIIMLLFSNNYVFADTPIRNTPQTTKEQAIAYLSDRNAEQEFIDLIPFIYEYCEDVGVEPTLVVAQISLETNFFRSSLSKSKYNTSGMKQPNGDYMKFDSYKEGIKAEINHLNLYAGYPDNHKSWLNGWCKTVEGLSGKWAEDKRYSSKLLNIINEIKSYEECEVYSEEEDSNIVDKKQDKNQDKEENKKQDKKEKKSNLLYNILNREKKHSNGFNKIMEYLKR